MATGGLGIICISGAALKHKVVHNVSAEIPLHVELFLAL
jgi:hypothetical protein